MIQEVLFNKDEIESRVKSLANEINVYYNKRPIIVVTLLRGGMIFASDLVRNLDMPLELDFLTTSSYMNSQVSSGQVNILHDLRSDVADKDVLIVDDIIDTGHTLKRVCEHIMSKKPSSVKLCTMLDKPSRREVKIKADFVGFEVEDVFIVGYGLDYKNYYRNTPYIFKFLTDGEENDK